MLTALATVAMDLISLMQDRWLCSPVLGQTVFLPELFALPVSGGTKAGEVLRVLEVGAPIGAHKLGRIHDPENQSELISSQTVRVSFPSALIIFLLMYICIFTAHCFYVFVHHSVFIFSNYNTEPTMSVPVKPCYRAKVLTCHCKLGHPENIFRSCWWYLQRESLAG